MALTGPVKQLLANSPFSTKNNDIPTAVFKDGNGLEYQGVVLVDGDGNIQTAIPTAPQLVTYTLTRPSVSNASSQIFPANAARKAGSYLVNNTSVTIYLAFDANAAVLNQGSWVAPGGTFLWNSKQRLNGIQSGGAVNIDAIEAT